MPKVGMEPIRRRQMIDATMVCIEEDGIGKASMQRIARKAGVTSGLIVHYFDDKEGLLEAVYLDLFFRVREETLKRLKFAQTPYERVFAITEAQVCDEMMEPRMIKSSFAICSKLAESESLTRIERINAGRFLSNLTHALRQIGLPREEAGQIAQEIRAMTYGVWLTFANAVEMSAEKARSTLIGYLNNRMDGVMQRASGSVRKAKAG
ncbi:MAG: transcriptional regulator BetI [Alphaproteobacteria bacterium]